MISRSDERAALSITVERGESHSIRILHRVDWPAAPVVDALRDPDAFITHDSRKKPRSKKKEARRRRRKRLVGWRHVEFDGRRGRLFVKLYRLRSMKDWLEELAYGKRAIRALTNGLEAERRGIAVPPHLGAMHVYVPGSPARWPRPSALAMVGLPTRRDVREALLVDFRSNDSRRREFLAAVGAFCADLHRRGIAHGDLKAGNIIVLETAPPRFSLLDLDRSSYRLENRARLDLKDAIDLYRLLQSLHRVTSRRERLHVLAAYLRARRLSRRAQRTWRLAIAAKHA